MNDLRNFCHLNSHTHTELGKNMHMNDGETFPCRLKRLDGTTALCVCVKDFFLGEEMKNGMSHTACTGSAFEILTYLNTGVEC